MRRKMGKEGSGKNLNNTFLITQRLLKINKIKQNEIK